MQHNRNLKIRFDDAHEARTLSETQHISKPQLSSGSDADNPNAGLIIIGINGHVIVPRDAILKSKNGTYENISTILLRELIEACYREDASMMMRRDEKGELAELQTSGGIIRTIV